MKYSKITVIGSPSFFHFSFPVSCGFRDCSLQLAKNKPKTTNFPACH